MHRRSWHYQVYDISKEQADQIRSLSFVDEFAVSKPLGYTEFAPSGNPGVTPYLELKEYPEALFEWMNIRVKEGRYPENADEVIISERAVKEGADIKPGDTVEIDCFERYVHAFTDEEQKAAREEGRKAIKIFFPPGFHPAPGETLKAPAHLAYIGENDQIEMVHQPMGMHKNLTVVGIMEEPYYGAQGQGGYIAITGTEDTVSGDEAVNAVFTINLNTKEDCTGEIAKILDTSGTPEEREAAINAGRSYTTQQGERIPFDSERVVSNDTLLTFTAKGQDGTVNFLMIFCQAFFVILITAASLVLIYNVFSMSYQERCKYLGMLSSVGATRRQKRWSVYYEVFSLLSLALPLGIGIGLLVIKGGMALLYPHFSKIMASVAQNVITGKSCEIACRLVINPVNILFVVIFSLAAVWISAWIPAHKISKIGPVESIRGNVDAGKRRKKGYKSYLSLMRKGKAEQLLGTASVERNLTSTRGIIRSITAFTTVTLITAFAARSITDLMDSMVRNEQLYPGTAFSGYSYMLRGDHHVDDALYRSGKESVMTSADVSEYKEMNVVCGMDCVPLKYYKDEYTDVVTEILEKWFPYGVPETLMHSLIGKDRSSKDPFTNPMANFIILDDADFHKVADQAGISLAGYEGAEADPLLVYESLTISTDDYRFFDSGAQRPDYTAYDLTYPLSVKEGETMDLEMMEYDENGEKTLDAPFRVTFAGYVSASAIREFYTLRGDELFFIISEQTLEHIKRIDPVFGRDTRENALFFNTNTEDSGLLRTLSRIQDQYGRNAFGRTGMYSEYDSFKGAVKRIADIVAVCFTLMIALICLLNLYNSVMGRYLARHKELAVLDSMGMTRKQKNQMLMIENIRLLARAFIRSALITLAFVICFHKLLAWKLGSMQFTFPVWVVIITLLASIAGLTVFTRACYGHNSKKRIIEEIRMESI